MMKMVFTLLFLACLCATSFAQGEQTGIMNRIFIGDREAPPAPESAGQELEEEWPDLPEPDFLSNTLVDLNEKEKTALRLSQEWKERPVKPLMMKNGQLKYVFGATLPTIICSPFMPSDVELQPGEIVNDVNLADTQRWSISIGRSGPPGNESVHLIIKPFDANLVTGAVVTTNRRTYHLRLVSQREGYTPYVGFLYPEDQKQALAAQIQQQKRQTKMKTMPVGNKIVDLSKLDFNYRITGDAPWKPVQVYNDGTRTIIRLPESAKKTELPVLLVEKAGQQKLVNYRVRGNGFIVDEPFQVCILIAGVGDNQEKVKIERLEEE